MATERPKSSFFRRDDSNSQANENREVTPEKKSTRESREAQGGEQESGERRERRPRVERSNSELNPRNENDGERREWKPRSEGSERRPYGDRQQTGERREWKPRSENDGERREWKPRSENSDRRPYGDRQQTGERHEWKPRNENSGERREWKPRSEGSERRSYGDRQQTGERREWKPRNENNGERREWKPRNDERESTREWKPKRIAEHTSDSESNGPRTYLTRERRLKDRAADAPLTEKITNNDPKAPMRLNRFIAISGVCSRREADILITEGQVTVNGQVVNELGTKVTREDEIRLNGELLKGEKKVYIIMNKPKGYVTTTDDPHADRTILDLFKGEVKERVYPVGRLDKNTTGVLLVTNDGELTNELTHPSYEKQKIYHVFLNKPCTEEDLATILTGVELEDGEIKADAAEFVDNKQDEVGIEIHSGRNRIVRRMFEHLGYDVVKLDRVYFAGFTKMGLRRGFWRHLTPREVATLKGGSYN